MRFAADDHCVSSAIKRSLVGVNADVIVQQLEEVLSIMVEPEPRPVPSAIRGQKSSKNALFDLDGRREDDLILCIAFFLSPSDVCAFAESCNRFNSCSHALASSAALWHWQQERFWQSNSECAPLKTAVFNECSRSSASQDEWSKQRFLEIAKLYASRCCVECSKPSPYTFPLLNNVRLCETCEKQSQGYQVVTAVLAEEIYAMDERQCERLGLPNEQVTGADGRVLKVFLRTHVAEASIEVYGSASGVRNALQQTSADRWKANSFKQVGGKTVKWKGRGKATYHAQQRLNKQSSGGGGDDNNSHAMRTMAMMQEQIGMSVLSYVGYESNRCSSSSSSNSSSSGGSSSGGSGGSSSTSKGPATSVPSSSAGSTCKASNEKMTPKRKKKPITVDNVTASFAMRL